MKRHTTKKSVVFKKVFQTHSGPTLIAQDLRSLPCDTSKAQAMILLNALSFPPPHLSLTAKVSERLLYSMHSPFLALSVSWTWEH